MSSKIIPIPLNSAYEALCYAWADRAQLEPDSLESRMPQSFYGSRINADYDVPQLIYGENILPTPAGLASAEPRPQLVPGTLLPAIAEPHGVLQLVPASGLEYYLLASASDPYCTKAEALVWKKMLPFLGGTYQRASCANIGGRSFVCFPGWSIQEFTDASYVSGTFAGVPGLVLPGGLALTDILGIGQFGTYLLLYTANTIYWSTPADVLNFSDIDQGAGQLTPLALQGEITGLRETAQGFFVLATGNILAATFTGNAAAPFSFKTVPGAGGCKSSARFTLRPDGEGVFYALTTSGLQRLTFTSAAIVLPELTGYLSGAVTEEWISGLHKVVPDALGDTPNEYTAALALISSRYLVVSFAGSGAVVGPENSNVNAFTDALVYDTALQRWGHLKTPHNAVLEDVGTSFTSIYSLAPWKAVRLIRASGAVYGLDLHLKAPPSGAPLIDSVAIFGRIQQNRQRWTTLLHIEVDNFFAGEVWVAPSEGGASRSDPVLATLVETVGTVKRYELYETAVNFDIIIEGQFNLANLQVTVRNHGRR